MLCQLGVNFRSAYFDEAKGVLVADPSEIACAYVKSWFVIDFVSCLPVQYIAYWNEIQNGNKGTRTDENSGTFRLMKTLRLLRLGKMLRIAKFSRMLKKYPYTAVARSNSPRSCF